MISDVLFDCVEHIKDYQAHGYKDPELHAEIEAVKAAMTRLRVKLDAGCLVTGSELVRIINDNITENACSLVSGHTGVTAAQR